MDWLVVMLVLVLCKPSMPPELGLLGEEQCGALNPTSRRRSIIIDSGEA